MARWNSGVFSLIIDDLKNKMNNAPVPDTPRNSVSDIPQSDQCCFNGFQTPNFTMPEALIFTYLINS
jgi:hypothetical protein